MLAIGPLMILVSIGGGYWLATRSLRPVDQMTQTAARITAQQLDSRLEVANPHDELGRLALTFNALLDRLERSFTELRKFTADAAHEFRTPLAVIRTSLEVALRSPRTPGYYETCLQAVAEENERLTSLANQLLLLAQEDAGLTDNVAEPVDLADLVERVKNDLEPLADEKSQVIRCELAADIWVDGDSQALRRVCLNLLDNALKFTPAGGEIELRLKTALGKAELTIADTGPGIAAEHLPHIFERFYRVDSSRNRETGGAGLGLAICRAIVVRHGGEIRLTSDHQETSVRVELPLMVSPSVPASQVAVLTD
jgi:heavy metal sensor kinase